MSENGIYGTEVEIKSFSEIYNVNIKIQKKDLIFSYDTCTESNLRLTLLFSGNNDDGHYDILNYDDLNIEKKLKENKNLTGRKRKILYDNTCDDQCEKRKLDKLKFEKEIEYNETSNYGEMTIEWSFCNAKFWTEERIKTNCCKNKKIILPKLSHFDEKLKNLLLNDSDFRILIRYYNNLFSFATFNAKVLHDNTKAVYNLKIQRQVCHMTPNSIIGEKGSLTQLFIYDDLTKVEKYLKINDHLRNDHIKILSNVLNKNPYTKKYKYLHKIGKIEKLVNYKMYFIWKTKKEKHLYNKPLTSKCGAIIIFNTGVIEDYDLCVYPNDLPENTPKHTYLNRLS